VASVTPEPGPAFEQLRPPDAGALPIVLHVPHAGTHIPPEVRAGILLDDAALQRQRVLLTDWHTDRLFDWLPALGAHAFINRRSRLVVDPERFADDTREPMAARGQGAVYTATTDLTPLRAPDPVERARLMATVFEPYHAALTALVEDVLDRFGRCLIVDGHSFGTVPLPSEVDQGPDRPDICIGTDESHTPPALAAALLDSYARVGFRVRRDSPFAGALVPIRHHATDLRVASVMIEVRRGLYCDETTSEPLATFDAMRDRIRLATLTAIKEWVGSPGHP
jgi:N-formylglutamate amidohydrolase